MPSQTGIEIALVMVMESISVLPKNKKTVSALWAIDPLDTEHLPNPQSLAQAKIHLGGTFENITPIYICDPHFVDVASPEEKVSAYLQSLQPGPIHPPEILFSKSEKKSDLVKLFLQEAQSRKSNLIILTNHGRRGLSKLLIGSFAETLLKKSSLPILFLGEDPSPKSHWNRMMFATDFTSQSYQSFVEFLKFASETASELLLFHAIALPASALASIHLGGLATSFSGPFWYEQIEWAKQESQKWIQDANQLGLKTHLHTIVKEAVGSPASAILEVAKREGVSLIGVSSHGPKVFFPSITKDVLASSEFEVWATGPRFQGISR